MQDADKTWINLKTHFCTADKAHRELKLIQDPTSAAPTTYPGSANNATAPPTQVELLTTAVNKLVKALVSPGGVVAGGTSTPTTLCLHTPVASNLAGGRKPTAAEAAMTCTRHHIGHEPTAMADNKMGGETRICNSWRTDGNRRQQHE
jgi:hypothetical protein